MPTLDDFAVQLLAAERDRRCSAASMGRE